MQYGTTTVPYAWVFVQIQCAVLWCFPKRSSIQQGVKRHNATPFEQPSEDSRVGEERGVCNTRVLSTLSALTDLPKPHGGYWSASKRHGCSISMAANPCHGDVRARIVICMNKRLTRMPASLSRATVTPQVEGHHQQHAALLLLSNLAMDNRTAGQADTSWIEQTTAQ